MQNVVRRILGFVAQLVSPAVDTSIADEAWWQAELNEIEEEHYQKLGDWYSEEVTVKCISCETGLTIQRWQQCGDGRNECDKCAALEQERYEDFLADCEAANN